MGFVGLLVLLLVWVIQYSHESVVHHIVTVQEFVSSSGKFAPLVYILIYALATVAFLPGAPFTVIGGALFGVLYGTVYVVIGATVGASFAFFLTRYTRRNTNNLPFGVSQGVVLELNRMIIRHGFLSVLMFRLIPLFPFNVLNFGFGFTGVGTSQYILGTFLGIIPGTFAYVYFGYSLASFRLDRVVIAILFILLLAVVSNKIRSKLIHKTTSHESR